MKEIIMGQPTTTSRYELTLIEKRIFYYIIKEVRSKYNTGQQDLLMICTIFVFRSLQRSESETTKRNPESPGEFRLRSFTYAND
jgi:hypothetical protein